MLSVAFLVVAFRLAAALLEPSRVAGLSLFGSEQRPTDVLYLHARYVKEPRDGNG